MGGTPAERLLSAPFDLRSRPGQNGSQRRNRQRFLSPPVRRILPTLLLSLTTAVLPAAAPVWSAEANFYTMQDQWAKNNKPEKNGKEKAVEDGFTSALRNRSVRDEDIMI